MNIQEMLTGIIQSKSKDVLKEAATTAIGMVKPDFYDSIIDDMHELNKLHSSHQFVSVGNLVVIGDISEDIWQYLMNNQMPDKETRKKVLILTGKQSDGSEDDAFDLYKKAFPDITINLVFYPGKCVKLYGKGDVDESFVFKSIPELFQFVLHG